VYGLLVDATNQQAVEKLIYFKNRPPGKAISVFVQSLPDAKTYVEISEKQTKLLETLIPGPFTFVLPSKGKTNPKLESEKHALGIRIPDFSLVSELSKAFGKPITATSANLGGKSPHYSIQSLIKQLPKAKQELIDLVVDYGKLPRNKPSTVVDLSAPQMKIIRHGDIIVGQKDHFHTKTARETQKLGSYVVDRLLKNPKKKPIVCVLQGDLGSGKTQFVKGAAKRLGIEKILSPTFVVMYEYPIQKQIGTTSYELRDFVHADLYNIEDPSEFGYLGFESYLTQGNLLFIEWGEKLGDMYDTLKQKAEIIHITLRYAGEKERDIEVLFTP